MTEKIKKFIGKSVYYDEHGQMIFGEKEPGGGNQLLLNIDVRGWGAIQHLFPFTDDGTKNAEQFQDKLGEWIAEAINEKLKKDE